MDKKDARLNLRINSDLKKSIQLYCEKRGIELSELTTRFFSLLIAKEKKRKEDNEP